MRRETPRGLLKQPQTCLIEKTLVQASTLRAHGASRAYAFHQGCWRFVTITCAREPVASEPAVTQGLASRKLSGGIPTRHALKTASALLKIRYRSAVPEKSKKTDLENGFSG